ncbi:MAG: beta strand repeat-containing protein [Armatimonadota bacterium]
MSVRNRSLSLSWLFVLVAGSLAWAQTVPGSISYQGKLTDSSGQVVPDGAYQAQFKLYDVETGGTAFWTSPVGSVTTSAGVFMTQLEAGTPTLAPSLLSGKTSVWLEVLIGSPPTTLPRVRLTSVSFAFRSDALTLPFSATVASSSAGVAVTNTGTGTALEGTATGGGNAVKGYVGGSGQSGSAGLFQVSNPSDKSAALMATTDAQGPALSATTSGTGSAAWFSISNTTSMKPAVEAETRGLANAGSFTINNASNTAPALSASTNGSGPALKATAGTGLAGQFEGVLQTTGFTLTTAPTAGYVLTSDASGSGTWQPGGLSLPFSGSVSSPSTAFSVTNTGTGGADSFQINNGSSAEDALFIQSNASGDGIQATHTGSGDAVVGYTSGTGSAANFTISNSANSSDAVRITTNSSSTSGDGLYVHTSGAGNAIWAVSAGTNRAGYFQISNGASSADALYGQTNGSGDAVHGTGTGSGDAVEGYTSGTGSAGRFTVSNTSSTANAVYISTDAASSSANGLYAATTGGGDAIHAYCSGSGDAIYGYSTGTSRAGYFRVNNTSSSADAVYVSTNTSGDALDASSSGSGNAIRGYMSGDGKAGYFRVANVDSTQAALFATTDATDVVSASAVYGVHTSSTNYGYIASGQYGVYGKSFRMSGSGVYGEASANNAYGVYGYASYNAAGSSNYGVRGVADGQSGRGGSFTATGTTGYGIQATASNTGAYTNYGGHFTANGTSGIGIYAVGGTSGKAAVLRGNVVLQDRATGSTVMELGTGLDYAEGFDVTDAGGIAPGSVLVIDSANRGKLALSRKPYDRCVAGIVAGAKKMGSGVRLGAGQFDRDVALAGRVYCNVDATRMAVKPGDLLTTSSTPGYAMKATDHRRAQGAILGKAMEPLAKGRKGQILVLVTLQ